MRPAAVSLWLRPSAADRAPFATVPGGLRGGMADYERAQTVEAPAEALFAFLAEIGNLPRYFEQMTAAEPAGGEAVRVTAEVDGREREGEAWFRVDRESRRVEWGSEGPNDYHGWLDVTDEGGGRSTVAVHVSTERVEDRPDEINQGLERTLGNVRRLVEEAGAAGT
jgi:uncharacterized membrane protein